MFTNTMFTALCCDGPDDGETLTVREIRPFEAHLAVMSRHGEGYYALEHGPLLTGTRRRARWVPHPDAAFPWTIARSRRPIGGPPHGRDGTNNHGGTCRDSSACSGVEPLRDAGARPPGTGCDLWRDQRVVVSVGLGVDLGLLALGATLVSFDSARFRRDVSGSALGRAHGRSGPARQ